MQLFWHCKELMSALHDRLTLALLDIHDSFGVSGYDLVRAALRFASGAREAELVLPTLPGLDRSGLGLDRAWTGSGQGQD